MLSIRRWEATLIMSPFGGAVSQRGDYRDPGQLARNGGTPGRGQGPAAPTCLFDEFADLSVDGRVAHQRAMRDARGFRVGGAAQRDARIRIDDFVAGRPPGAVVDGA